MKLGITYLVYTTVVNHGLGVHSVYVNLVVVLKNKPPHVQGQFIQARPHKI